MPHSLALGSGVMASTSKLTRADRRHILARMRSVVSVALVLLQLSPAVGAVMCMRMTINGAATCTMPMPARSHDGDRSTPGPAQDCAVMAVCAPAILAVPSPVVALCGMSPHGPASLSAPASLYPNNPVAPPKPPPIS